MKTSDVASGINLSTRAKEPYSVERSNKDAVLRGLSVEQYEELRGRA
jgi:hypothetical protein